MHECARALTRRRIRRYPQGGSIGTIVALSRDDFSFLSTIQDNVGKVVSGVGGLDHTEVSQSNP
jgi:hypothetical protein